MAPVMAPAAADAAKRVALVIGNDAYANVPPLAKAGNDARAVAAKLRGNGFEVLERFDLDRRSMNRAVRDFTRLLSPGDVALFFFAGHGIEIGGRSHLLPTDIPDVRPDEEDYVREEAFAFADILARMERRGASLTISIIDACRDNPFTAENGRSVGSTRGLSRVTSSRGSFVMHSAGPGEVALDRLGENDPDPNSVFTRKLLPLIGRPGLDLIDMVKTLQTDVSALARTVSHAQTPDYRDQIDGKFYFAEAAEPTQASMTAPAKPGQSVAPSGPSQAELDRDLWNALGPEASVAEYEAYLAQFPNGLYAGLARARIEKLRAQQASAPAATAPEPETEPAADRLEDRIARFKSAANGPSFDCAKAGRSDEFAICASPRLSALDRVLSEEFRALKRSLSGSQERLLRLKQSEWLAERGRCPGDQCIEATTIRRIRELQNF